MFMVYDIGLIMYDIGLVFMVYDIGLIMYDIGFVMLLMYICIWLMYMYHLHHNINQILVNIYIYKLCIYWCIYIYCNHFSIYTAYNIYTIHINLCYIYQNLYIIKFGYDICVLEWTSYDFCEVLIVVSTHIVTISVFILLTICVPFTSISQ